MEMTGPHWLTMKTDQVQFVAAHTPVAWPRRVLIVDDHAATLAALRSLLEREYPRIEVVGTASDGDTAMQIVRRVAPDVVVLDLDLGGEYGLDLMPAIGGRQGAAVVILTASDDPLERTRALAAGAEAFVSKFSPAEALIAAILAARPGSID